MWGHSNHYSHRKEKHTMTMNYMLNVILYLTLSDNEARLCY